ncbi:BTB/POZ and TAZ domain-containing protein 3-like isoform X1 [Chenopodium quinoa]|uniref:BTB/POZ and TAZ domain-containing protein 3-like isoform X1 n=1 Tax=Chenopodium quinoa TaxID=63459 RepID=UPI000B787DA9|nr:BTB/POZ and TAZ domain-containing protein 3-like isoform X1 [Chenopodium quinoa]
MGNGIWLMASALCDYSWTSSPSNGHMHSSFDIRKSEKSPAKTLPVLETPISSSLQSNIPAPPPLPKLIIAKRSRRESSQELCGIPKETRDMWDNLFEEGYAADVYLITEDNGTVPAHFCVLSIASPVLGKYLQDSKLKDGVRYVKIPGVPNGAVCAFIRFLYSSCYEEEDMKKFVLHLLVLSHFFVVPLLKRVCMRYLENNWLNTENVIDVLQLARQCDAPRLTFVCIRMVVRHFKTVASTEGWKVMRRVNPALEQELLEAVVEADSRKQERQNKMEEKKVYLRLHKAIEALLHICKDGCSTIGPRDKMLKGGEVSCGFPACKGVEMLVRHFFICKTRVPGGCVQCKRMWQLLELHSRMCDVPESCNVPLCRHFKEKVRQQSKKDEAKWKLLVRKVIEAKNSNHFAARFSGSS